MDKNIPPIIENPEYVFMSRRMAFVYYNPEKGIGKVHIEDDNNNGDPLCGTSYGIDNGEYLFSYYDYDRIIAENYGVSLDIVTCKKCLKKANKVQL